MPFLGLFNILGVQEKVLSFESLSGTLQVFKKDELLTLDFPAQPAKICSIPSLLSTGLGKTPLECLEQNDYLAVFEKEDDILSITTNNEDLKKLDHRGIIVTAPSTKFDFVVRFFAPKFGINEDPVTGSAYTQLIPYWSARLGKSILNAKQVSQRGGRLLCEHKDDRVFISGSAVMYMKGSIYI